MFVLYQKADLYVSDDDIIPRQISDTHKLAEFPIKMPLLRDIIPGTRLDVTLEFIFGSTEIKIVVHLAGTISEHVIESGHFLS